MNSEAADFVIVERAPRVVSIPIRVNSSARRAESFYLGDCNCLLALVHQGRFVPRFTSVGASKADQTAND